MTPSDLWTRLAAEARVDVAAEATRFERESGDVDPDRFLACLHRQRKIRRIIGSEDPAADKGPPTGCACRAATAAARQDPLAPAWRI